MQRLRRLRVSAPIQLGISLLSLVIAGASIGASYVKVKQVAMASSLCDVAQAGDLEQMQDLLKRGADPNALNAMGYARQGGHREAIQLLEQAGAKEKTSRYTP